MAKTLILLSLLLLAPQSRYALVKPPVVNPTRWHGSL